MKVNMTTDVETILRQIDDLSSDERTRLEQRLAERAEVEWQREAESARREALARGITQDEIDSVVERCRSHR